MSDLFIDSITKKFGDRPILTDVFMTCKKGDIVGLLGRNGCGKSTLLKIVFGSLRADSRFVKVGQKRLKRMSDNSKLIKYLPQDSFLPNHLKVESIINLFSAANDGDTIKNDKLIAPILNRKVDELSGGERRILEILLISYSDSKYTLIDEPFNGVAPLYKENIKELISLQSAKKGIIITDHDYRNVLKLATRVILIHNGSTKEIQSLEDLIKWGYLPSEESVTFKK